MTRRAIALGLLAGCLISAWAYFNDHVIRQSWLTGSLLPVVVFGGLIVLLWTVNPLLSVVRRGAALATRECLVITAIAMAAAALPGIGFFKYFTSVTAVPVVQNKTQPAWQAHELLAYIPGGTQDIAPAQVRDWPDLARRLSAAPQHEDQRPLAAVWAELSPDQQQTWRETADAVIAPKPAQLARSLNAAMRRVAANPDAQLTAAQVHQALLDVCGDLIATPPPGRGTLLASEDAAAALTRGGEPAFIPRRVPWADVMPSLALWGGMALLLGGAGLCLAVIVHPQWSRHELLPYPIARFVQEICDRPADSPWPAIARERLFYIGLGAVTLLHIVNGLHAWFQQLPEIRTSFDLGPLRQLFPTAYQVPNSFAYFQPQIFPAVVGLGFLLTRSVSFSLGISPLVWIMLGAFLITRGQSLSTNHLEPNSGTFLRLGAWLAIAIMIAYYGRAYYTAIACRAMPGAGIRYRLKDNLHISPAAIWAARLLVLLIAAATALLCTAGLPWGWSLTLVLMCLLVAVVMSRLVAETGLFFISPPFFPITVLVGLLGFEAIGPSAYLIMAVGSTLLVGDTKEALMPNLLTALRIADNDAPAETPATRPRTIAPWLAVMFTVGFVVAAVATLTLQHQHGLDWQDFHATQAAPRNPFNKAAAEMSELTAAGHAADIVAASPLQRLGWTRPDRGTIGFLAAGVALTLAIAVARTRLHWWPFHPALLATLGMWSVSRFAASFLLAWLIKTIVVNISGAAGYRRTLPLMLGLVAGDLLGAILWMILGALYYLTTGLTPASYRVFP